MAKHLTPDELHELWSELRIELKRLGGRPGTFDVDDETATTLATASAGSAASAAAAAYEACAASSDWSTKPPDLSAAVMAAREAGAPERLLRILEALSRMRTGRYGICLACHGPIPFARLLAVPETTSCIDCGGARAAGRG
jgi:RNA polymerase-binding transcription factor DksA